MQDLASNSARMIAWLLFTLALAVGAQAPLAPRAVAQGGTSVTVRVIATGAVPQLFAIREVSPLVVVHRPGNGADGSDGDNDAGATPESGGASQGTAPHGATVYLAGTVTSVANDAYRLRVRLSAPIAADVSVRVAPDQWRAVSADAWVTVASSVPRAVQTDPVMFRVAFPNGGSDGNSDRAARSIPVTYSVVAR